MCAGEIGCPDNIRQRINVIQRAKILAEDRFITTNELSADVLNSAVAADIVSGATPLPTMLAEDGTLASIEKTRVVDVMQMERGNKDHAGR